ncbi:hypothetical protein AMS68_002636 [Peltaster fructicola]|uniref:Heterokaryon incompatibility domain-containing protein n=1 Tax=Peltaster fructicola TaxID=286661 RepID=A0A6H0XR64_9PEZI|nr:hypothetical protein AMS68_002636 [Peltaster fructicola]
MLCRICDYTFFDPERVYYDDILTFHYKSYGGPKSIGWAWLYSLLDLKLTQPFWVTFHYSAAGEIHDFASTSISLPGYDRISYGRDEYEKRVIFDAGSPLELLESNANSKQRIRARIGSRTRNAGCVLGRPIADGVDYALCLSWLKQCIREHKVCREPREPGHPTRLLRIAGQKVFLAEVNNQDLRYVALSHCWGSNSQPLVTNSSNVRIHISLGIDILQLPLTFQDAVTATLKLGFDHLWIDTLCIIQDSEDDWSTECQKMGGIYSNAVLTIAPPGAKDVNTGFLKGRQTCHDKERASIELEHHSAEPAYRKHDTVVISSESLTTILPVKAEMPPVWAKRGWTLQQRLLSSRILYFGTKQLYFECHALTRYEDIWPAIPHSNWQDRAVDSEHRVPKDFMQPDTSVEHALARWYDVVHNFVSRSLSRESDKLPALSGIARCVQRCLQAEYYAGLWSTDMVYGLSWMRLAGADQHAKCQIPVEHRGPSWSWSSCDYDIDYHHRPRRIYGYEAGFEAQAAVVGVTVQAIRDTFGQIRSGECVVRSRVKPAVIREAYSTLHGDLPEALRLFDSQTGALVGNVILDQPYTPQSHACFEKDVKCVLLGNDFHEGKGAWYALALEPVNEPSLSRSDCYLRIGMVCSSMEYEQGFYAVGPRGESNAMEESIRKHWFDDGLERTVRIQ